MASFRTPYNDPAAQAYNITDAINSLATLVQRSKENEQVELNKKFNSIMQAPGLPCGWAFHSVSTLIFLEQEI